MPTVPKATIGAVSLVVRSFPTELSVALISPNLSFTAFSHPDAPLSFNSVFSPDNFAFVSEKD